MRRELAINGCLRAARVVFEDDDQVQLMIRFTAEGGEEHILPTGNIAGVTWLRYGYFLPYDGGFIGKLC